jgi:hypothetical protein
VTRYCLAKNNAREKAYGYCCEVSQTCFVHSKQPKLEWFIHIIGHG